MTPGRLRCTQSEIRKGTKNREREKEKIINKRAQNKNGKKKLQHFPECHAMETNGDFSREKFAQEAWLSSAIAGSRQFPLVSRKQTPFSLRRSHCYRRMRRGSNTHTQTHETKKRKKAITISARPLSFVPLHGHRTCSFIFTQHTAFPTFFPRLMTCSLLLEGKLLARHFTVRFGPLHAGEVEASFFSFPLADAVPYHTWAYPRG